MLKIGFNAKKDAFLVKFGGSCPNFKDILAEVKSFPTSDRRYKDEKKTWEIKRKHARDIFNRILPMDYKSKVTPTAQAVIDEIRKDALKGVTYKLVVGANETEVVSDEELPEEAINLMSYRAPGEDYNPYSSFHDGWSTLYDKSYRCFPTGIYPRIERLLKSMGATVEVEDNREYIGIEKEFEWDWYGHDLRDYQEKAVEDLIKARRAVAEIATGGGKTAYIATAMTQRLGLRTIFFVHTKLLLYQAKEEFEEKLGVEVGIVGDEQNDVKPITIAMIQSTVQKMGHNKEIQKMLKEHKLVFVDECHHVAADTYQEVMEASEAEYKVGLSASPWRDDGLDILIEAGAGSKVVEIKPKYLIKKGFLVQPRIRMIGVKHKFSSKDYGQHYEKVYKKYIYENESRNMLVIESTMLLADRGKTVLVLVQRIKHGEELTDALNAKGYKAMYLQGKDSQKKRKEVLDSIEDGTLNILVATTIADEGLDLPVLDSIVLAGAGKSSTKALQRIGRSLRLSDGKKFADIVDFYDKGGMFSNQSKLRAEIYRESFGKKSVKVIKPEAVTKALKAEEKQAVAEVRKVKRVKRKRRKAS